MNAQQQTELSYTQMAAVTEAMAKKGHTAGRVRYERMRTGKVYAYVTCTNKRDGVACGTAAEYSLERDKLTKSTVAYRCSYN